MITELQSIISTNLLQGSMVSGVIALILLIWRSKPITMFTSTDIEKIIYTKEKKVFIKVIDRSFQSFLIAMLFLISIFSFAILDKTRFFIISLWIALVILFSLTIYFIWKMIKPGIKNYFKDMSLNKKGIHGLMTILYLFLLFLIVPLTVGAMAPLKQEQLDSIIDNYQNERLFIWIIAVMILILSFFYRELFSRITNFFDVQMNNIIETNLYIKHEVEGELSDWYLFHPTENNQILIGDQNNIHNCHSFYFIERSELVKKKICRAKKSNSEESSE